MVLDSNVGLTIRLTCMRLEGRDRYRWPLLAIAAGSKITASSPDQVFWAVAQVDLSLLSCLNFSIISHLEKQGTFKIIKSCLLSALNSTSFCFSLLSYFSKGQEQARRQLQQSVWNLLSFRSASSSGAFFIFMLTQATPLPNVVLLCNESYSSYDLKPSPQFLPKPLCFYGQFLDGYSCFHEHSPQSPSSLCPLSSSKATPTFLGLLQKQPTSRYQNLQ